MCNAMEGSAHSVVTIAMLIVLMQMLMVNCVNANARFLLNLSDLVDSAATFTLSVGL